MYQSDRPNILFVLLFLMKYMRTCILKKKLIRIQRR
jgi:hypothetical protein